MGGSTVGAITNDRLGYEGHQVGVAVLSSPTIRFDFFKERGLADREEAAGEALGRQIRSESYEGEKNLLFMYDLVKLPMEGGMMHANTPSALVRGLGRGLGEWPPVAGFGMQGSFQLNPGYHFFGEDAEGELPEEQSILAVMLSGDVRMDTILMHGCRPASDYYTVTKADGNVVLELNGRKATDVVRSMLRDDSAWEDFPPYITLGLNKGSRYEPFDESIYSVRVCLAVDRERGGLVMGADDFLPGTEIQFMRRTIDFEDVARRTRSLLEGLGNRRPFFAFYIDCAGRTTAICGTDREEAEEVQRALKDVPLLGVYSGVEIARVGPEIVYNNMTGVVCLFSESGNE